MIRAALSLALALAPSALVAQTAGAVQDAPAHTMVLEIAAPAANCPVSLRAQQMPGGDRMMVNGVPGKAIAQMLHLTAIAPRSRQVVAANVTVRGYSSKARFLPTRLSNQDAADASKTLDVAFNFATNKETSADVSVAGFSAVTVVDLNSVTYSDGSTWKLAAGSACRSWIDGFMLVAAH